MTRPRTKKRGRNSPPRMPEVPPGMPEVPPGTRCTWCSEPATGVTFANGDWRPGCGSCRVSMGEHAVTQRQVDERDAVDPNRRRRRGGRGRWAQR